MDFSFKQWRDQQQHESEQQHQQQTRVEVQQQCYHEKQHEQQNQQETTSSGSVLPLFVVPENLSIKSRNLSAYPHSSPILPRMGGYLSLVQLQELELQALIYRHMVAGAAVPPDLLLLVKKSLLSTPHHFLQQSNTYPCYNPNWYWGRGAMDPEPGGCRRTDGKKWRCSRDVVAGQKYCERHVHRGRNRSRKPVESPTSTVTAVSTVGGGDDDGVNAGLGGSASTFAPKATSSGDHCLLAGAAAPRDMFQLNQGLPESKTNKKSFFE